VLFGKFLNRAKLHDSECASDHFVMRKIVAQLQWKNCDNDACLDISIKVNAYFKFYRIFLGNIEIIDLGHLEIAYQYL